MSDEAIEPVASVEQLRAAIAALGLQRGDALAKQSEDDERAYLLGVLLTIVEEGLRDLDRAQLPLAQAGQADTFLAFANGDPGGAGRGWAVHVNQRLNRTAIELQEATEGNGRMFIEVAGAAMLVAANIMNVLNHSGAPVEMFREMFQVADGNLKAARRNLGLLREQLRKDGMPL